MQTFNFPYHAPPSGTPDDGSKRVTLKGGFIFSTQPIGPIIRVYKLNFPTMSYFLLPDGSVDLEGTINPTLNVMALEKFYNEHGTWKPFIYPHPVKGNLKVVFDKPFTTPTVTGNKGSVKNIELSFREHP